MTRSAGAVAGTMTFLVAHAFEAHEWRAWFASGSAFEPWFLNSGRAVAFTAAFLFVVSAIVSAVSSADRRESLARGAYFSGGATAAMTFVLFVTGPGTIWPIVLISGAAIVVAMGVGGSFVGWIVRSGSRG